MTRSNSDFRARNAAIIAVVFALAVFALATVKAAPRNSTASPTPDAAASREAFLQVYKVFTSPRCQNCHPSGDGRSLPPLNRADTSAQMKAWIDGGAACPE